MPKLSEHSKSAIVRAKITYFFKETFRAHSKDEYREIFSRGLNEDNGGVTGAYPWLYVRAFFALFILFTINTLVLRFTGNPLFIPSVTFLGGVVFTVPFIILLYELYPKRDISLFMLIAVLVAGGTVAAFISQIGYYFVTLKNAWASAVYAGVLEEVSKALPAIIILICIKQKNPYASFLLAAAVGAGFSVIEDMGYIFYYSDEYVFYYNSEIQAIVSMFVDRGMSAFCTHVLWTGAIGWGFSVSKRPFRSAGLLVFLSSVALHICWDAPFEGWLRVVDICLCVVVTATMNVAIVYKSRFDIVEAEVDLTQVNEDIIREAKAMGEIMRFRNAANLTFALTCTFLSVIILVLCSLPIGMVYSRVEYGTKEEFISFVQGGYNLKADRSRPYDPEGDDVEKRYVDNGGGELILSYVVQRDKVDGFEGEYLYGYHVSDGGGELESIYVWLENETSRIPCTEYKFGSYSEWVFEVNSDRLIDYVYNEDGTVTAVTDAQQFEGYDVLTALAAAACAVSGICTVILTAFTIKLRRVKDERQ